MKTSKQWDIVLHRCTKNHDHMLHCSWNMAASVRCNCNFSFWAIFSPFTHPLARQPKKWKFKKNEKKNKQTKIPPKKNTWRYQHLPQLYQKSMCYTVPEIWCVTDLIVIFHFGLFFAFLLPPAKGPKNENFKTMGKHHYHFKQVYQKSWSYIKLFVTYNAWRM